jgi:hypothetical protein
MRDANTRAGTQGYEQRLHVEPGSTSASNSVSHIVRNGALKRSRCIDDRDSPIAITVAVDGARDPGPGDQG